MKAGFISLGCNKNLVDTEKTIALFKEHGYEIVSKPEEAEIIIINTCGFIESAKEEAINTILEMAEYKKQSCKYLIAMGCLVERYKEELQKLIPEVDLYIKYSEYGTLWEQIENLIKNDKGETTTFDFNEYTDRVITTGENYAYIKIADGCSNCCTFCAIPRIRGIQKSRTIESIVQEAQKLADDGYKEIILTAQDTTRYGQDIYGTPKLVQLLKEIEKIDKIKWIRILYSYPETITDELIKTVKEIEEKFSDKIEFIIIIIVIGLVLVSEIINTAIERLVDLVSPKYNKLAGEVKDIAASSVLLMCIFSLVVGVIIFVPKIINLLGGF